jgi:hypothetical protein
MIAHGAPRFHRIGGGDAVDDAMVLLLDALEIGAALGRRVDRQPHALARNDVAAEKDEEARELRIAGGLGDGAMEGEILSARSISRSAARTAATCFLVARSAAKPAASASTASLSSMTSSTSDSRPSSGAVMRNGPVGFSAT